MKRVLGLLMVLLVSSVPVFACWNCGGRNGTCASGAFNGGCLCSDNPCTPCGACSFYKGCIVPCTGGIPAAKLDYDALTLAYGQFGLDLVNSKAHLDDGTWVDFPLVVPKWTHDAGLTAKIRAHSITLSRVVAHLQAFLPAHKCVMASYQGSIRNDANPSNWTPYRAVYSHNSAGELEWTYDIVKSVDGDDEGSPNEIRLTDAGWSLWRGDQKIGEGSVQ